METDDETRITVMYFCVCVSAFMCGVGIKNVGVCLYACAHQCVDIYIYIYIYL